MQSLFSSICRSSALLLAALVAVSVSASAQKSDLELLRQEPAAATVEAETAVGYGLVAGRQTVNPFYHLASLTLFVWQNAFQSEVASEGGYAVSNPEYFKLLTERYGLLPAIFYGLDRIVRNTKAARAGYNHYPFLFDDKGRIVDTVDRYSSK